MRKSEEHKQRVRVVGVRYARNPYHLKGEAMSEDEQARTIAFLSEIDEKRPVVSIKPESDNPFDNDAYVVRWMSRKCGYVSREAVYKAICHAAMSESRRPYVRARVADVVVAENGYFTLELTLSEVPAPIERPDRWAGWELDVPAIRLGEDELMVKDALQMLEDMAEMDGDEIREYCDVIATHGTHALWREARERIEAVICDLEAMSDMHDVADRLHHLLSGMCNESHELERRERWWPSLLKGPKAKSVVCAWCHDKVIDICEPVTHDMKMSLLEIEQALTEIPAISTPDLEDETLLMTRACYADVPELKWRQLLSGLILRRYLRQILHLPQNGAAVTAEEMEEILKSYMDDADSDFCLDSANFDPDEYDRQMGIKEDTNNILNNADARALWECAKENEWVDDNCQPLISQNKAAILASVMADKLFIYPKWAPFEELWGVDDLSTKFSKAQMCKYYPDTMKMFEKGLST